MGSLVDVSECSYHSVFFVWGISSAPKPLCVLVFATFVEELRRAVVADPIPILTIPDESRDPCIDPVEDAIEDVLNATLLGSAAAVPVPPELAPEQDLSDVGGGSCAAADLSFLTDWSAQFVRVELDRYRTDIFNIRWCSEIKCHVSGGPRQRKCLMPARFLGFLGYLVCVVLIAIFTRW